MKRLIFFMLLSGSLSGCYATPLVIDNGSQSRIFTPCTNDNLCLRDSYSVTWDHFCSSYAPDYPISYRTKQSEYESNRVEYVLLPKNEVVEPARCGGYR